MTVRIRNETHIYYTYIFFFFIFGFFLFCRVNSHISDTSSLFKVGLHHHSKRAQGSKLTFVREKKQQQNKHPETKDKINI